MRSTSTKASQSTANRWFTLAWITPVALALLLAVVLISQWLRELPAVESFMTAFPGESQLPQGAPVGFPAWLSWQHFLNTFIVVLIIRSGWMVRTNQRPAPYWTRNNDSVIRTKNPPTKISLDLWFHLSLDAFWVLNGIVFYLFIFITGQWVRLVPTRWDVFPNALSTAIQYSSLNWPTGNGWVNYNSLQQLAYFTIVFIAAPLAILTGVRLSGAWPERANKLNRIFPVELARAIHYPVMLYFVLFIIVHVTLVMTTGALRNLNHMYSVRNDTSWVGFSIFAASLLMTIAIWMVARPLFLRPIAGRTGTLSRR